MRNHDEYSEEAQFQEQAQFNDEQSHLKRNNNKNSNLNNVPHPYASNPAIASGKKIPLTDSRQQVVHVANVASSADDRRNSGIVIRLKSLEEVGYVPNKFLVEIRNETNLVAEEGSAPARVTKLVTKNNPTWDEDFYYNNNVVLDDNISFILRDQRNKEVARTEVRNLSLQEHEQQPDQEANRKIFELDLKNQGQMIARLFVEISFYESEDILGGVLMPNLSLRPPANFKPQYNAIDTYKPVFTNNYGSKANCFNFFDGGILPGLDNVQVFPPKFTRRNKKVVQAQ